MSWFQSPSLAVSPLTAEALRSEVEGKAFLIVGGTKGIGAALARLLVNNGAQVTVSGRTKSDETPNEAEFIKCDVSTVANCRGLVQVQLKGRKFDTVVFTVGIISRSTLTRTADDIEEDLAVSYLSRFIITNELIKVDALEGRKRVYIYGYPGQNIKPHEIEDLNFERVPYKQWTAHMNTVVLNEALVYSLAQKYPDLRVYGLNPGLIQTGIRDNFHGGETSMMGRVTETLISWFNPTTDQYAANVLLPLVASPELQTKTGICFTKHGSEITGPAWGRDAENNQTAWKQSQALLAKVAKDAVY